MLSRTLTIIVSIPLILLLTYFGGIFFLLLVLGLALFSINEFYFLMGKKRLHPSYVLGNIITVVFILFANYTIKNPAWEPYAAGILTTGAIIALCSGIFVKKTEGVMDDIGITILGIVYIGWFFSYFVLLRSITLHGAYLYFLLFTVWAEDITAYLVGRFFGRIPLLPNISPKKTVEGAIAGFIVCLIAAEIFGYFNNFNLIHTLILGMIIGIIAPVSDLVESMIKRDAGAKDSGDIVPGHGGVLDRMDSFILTAPILYYYLTWFVLR